MESEKTEVLVIGAGQAGVAMSEHLKAASVPHLVVERGRIAERWRSERWDSLVANGPAWHDRFPGMRIANLPGDAFAPKESVAAYFEAYAAKFAGELRCGVEVSRLSRLKGQWGFQAETSRGRVEAGAVVVATGPFQVPVTPGMIPPESGILQIHSAAYRNPGQLPGGAVLVVGGGSSGAQIAEELLTAGRRVFLSIGAHDRPPRAYRGRDYCWWLGVLGLWDTEVRSGDRHVPIAVSGAHGGTTVDFRRLAGRGMVLLGRAESWSVGRMSFAPDLRQNLARGDANYLSVLDQADAWVRANGADLPEEPGARRVEPDAPSIKTPILSLDLAREGITTVIWATGFRTDFSWIDSGIFDDRGLPRHRRGVSEEPGLYFLGLPWLSRRGSSFIWGVWHDAKYIADQIGIQRNYLAYAPGD